RIDIKMTGVKVVVPKASGLDPEKFMEEKRKWVLKNYREMQDILADLPERTFEEGESFPYQGEEHEIKYSEVDQVTVKNREIHIPEEAVESKSPGDVLEDFLREKARQDIKSVIEKYSNEIEADYDKLYIRNQKTKWGSCSGKNNLSYNFRLIMAPSDVLEYVVVHELVHLEEPKHSKAFWRRLSDLLPEYQKSKDWLKKNQMELVLREEDIF
ncbi:M48 family metallopeptidase, partial [Candidatus Bipolaricaulota bacterium]|nr:M48 family metallopeptidase [Candidatus Bipolaricaulota bacterium]